MRALTLGVTEPHPILGPPLERAAAAVRQVGAAFAEAGFDVQTLRLSTRPVLTDLNDWQPAALARYGAELQDALDGLGVQFCSLGPAMPEGGAERAAALVDVIAGHKALSCSALVGTADGGLDVHAARGAARTMLRLAAETDEGFGNFSFAALACVGPGNPFFPAAYHSGPATLAVALQGAGIVAEALGEGAELWDVARLVGEKMTEYATPVVEMAQRLATELGIGFGGIDLSPAPGGEDSIAAAMELAGHGEVGSPGTLALAAALTTALQGSDLPTCGYCGLMLPVMEDVVLARRWQEARVGLDQLLAYSAVCGTGLDTVPVPGNCTVEELTRIVCDMASLAVRLRKPLSARLLPVPGKAAGEYTNFSSPYFTNTLIKPIG